MIYDGVVIRIDELYLFILDPDKNKIRDGINISEHECYKDLKDDQLMVVNVIFKDGTQEIDKIDLDEFIYGDNYGKHDTFLYIHDITLYSIGDTKNDVQEVKIKNIIEKGELNDVAISCINSTKIKK
jgi:hypothetical protein